MTHVGIIIYGSYKNSSHIQILTLSYMAAADRVLKASRTTMTRPQSAIQPTKTVLITLVPSQKPSLIHGCAWEGVVQSSKRRLPHGRAPLAWPRCRTERDNWQLSLLDTTLTAQAHGANLHTGPLPTPPTMEKAKAPGSHRKQNVGTGPQFSTSIILHYPNYSDDILPYDFSLLSRKVSQSFLFSFNKTI